MQNPSIENKSGAEKAEKTYQDQCRAQGQYMLPGKDHYRDHADKSVGHNKEQDKLQDFGIDHDRIPGIGADFGYHIRNAGPAARIVPEDQAVCKQVAGHTDYGAAEDKEKAHQHGRRTENPQPDQAVIQADEAEQDHADPVKPHAAAQHLVKRRNRAGQDGVEISVENHGRQLPDPFKQNAAQPFRQVKKGHDQIDLFLLPAGNRFDIAADNKWNQHPEEPCHNAGKQHEPEVQRIFHFCFYVLFLHFQKYLYHFSLLQLSGFCGCFCRTIHAAPEKCRSRRIGRRIPGTRERSAPGPAGC